MPRIAVPVLVMAGGSDPGMTPELLRREVVARIGGARMVTVPNAGHLLPLEAPGTLAKLVREHSTAWPVPRAVPIRSTDVNTSHAVAADPWRT
jgi:pimeloyl-ACP methyl ester carboxylesterase